MRPFLGCAFVLALGIYIIRFARSAFERPERTIERWYHGWPKFTPRGLRFLSVVWLFGGNVLIFGSISTLISIQPRLRTMIAFGGLATLLEIPWKRNPVARRNEGRD